MAVCQPQFGFRPPSFGTDENQNALGSGNPLEVKFRLCNVRLCDQAQIMVEQQDVWEIEKYLSLIKLKVKTKSIDLAAS